MLLRYQRIRGNRSEPHETSVRSMARLLSRVGGFWLYQTGEVRGQGLLTEMWHICQVHAIPSYPSPARPPGSIRPQVLLRPEDEEEWTSVNWELVRVKDLWLTEKIWVVDV